MVSNAVQESQGQSILLFFKFLTVSQLQQEPLLLLLHVPRHPGTLAKVDTIDI